MGMWVSLSPGLLTITCLRLQRMRALDIQTSLGCENKECEIKCDSVFFLLAHSSQKDKTIQGIEKEKRLYLIFFKVQ